MFKKFSIYPSREKKRVGFLIKHNACAIIFLNYDRIRVPCLSPISRFTSDKKLIYYLPHCNLYNQKVKMYFLYWKLLLNKNENAVKYSLFLNLLMHSSFIHDEVTSDFINHQLFHQRMFSETGMFDLNSQWIITRLVCY